MSYALDSAHETLAQSKYPSRPLELNSWIDPAMSIFSCTQLKQLGLLREKLDVGTTRP